MWKNYGSIEIIAVAYSLKTRKADTHHVSANAGDESAESSVRINS